MGYCTEGDRCNCGGDLPRIQAACANWKGSPPGMTPPDIVELMRLKPYAVRKAKDGYLNSMLGNWYEITYDTDTVVYRTWCTNGVQVDSVHGWCRLLNGAYTMGVGDTIAKIPVERL
jgi:hypothetical protein